MTITIIIPTLNEQSCIAETLVQVRQQNPFEIIVADGGSSDETCKLAEKADLLVHGQRGRARQMNLGARYASGDTLLFLHADCHLEPGALQEAKRVLDKKGVVAGCFLMNVRANGILYRTIDLCATARVRLTGLVYGDQGLFLYRDRFQHLGGFPNLDLMEDLYFSRQLRRHGRIGIALRRILVSPRRWQQTGLVRQTLRNWTLTSFAVAGVHPDKLATFYPAIRSQN